MLILMLLIGREMFVVRDGAGADGCVPFSTTRLLSHRRRRAGAITAFIIFKRDSLFVKDATVDTVSALLVLESRVLEVRITGRPPGTKI